MRISDFAEMPGWSRRRFCRLLATASLSVCVADGRAAILAPTKPVLSAADTLHAQGVRLLRQGLRFERAADYFDRAAQLAPRNPDHCLALGCAYASRAVSLSYAAGFAHRLSEARKNFGESVREWEEQRDETRAEDPKTFDAAEYEKTRPTMPHEREFRTKDDNQPYRLTRPQGEKRLNELSAKALAAWKKGLSLSMTPEEKAQAYYIQGWGIRVLRLYFAAPAPQDEEETIAPFTVKNIPTDAVALDAFVKATTLAPENPLYWQAKGDALGESDAAHEAYQKALELKPRNAADLWYWLYNRAAKNASTKPMAEWPAALEYLHRAQARDRGNAWPLYEEASVLFRYAPYSVTGPSGPRNPTPEQKESSHAAVRNDKARENGRRAIDRITEGNRAPRFDAPRYFASVPNLLSAAWRYVSPIYGDFVNFGSFARVRELARSGAGYAQFMAEYEKMPDEAERAAWAVVGLGNRMAGDWPVEDDLSTGKTVIQSLVGIAVAAIGYKSLETVYETLGNSDKKAAAQAENTAFKLRTETYKKAVAASLSRSEYDYY